MQIHYGYENHKRSPLKPIVLIIVAIVALSFLIFYIQMNSRAYDPCSYAFDYNQNGKTGDYQDRSICLQKYYSGRETTPEKPSAPSFKWWFW